MDIQSIIAQYQSFKQTELNDRFFKHQTVCALLAQLPSAFQQEIVGYSFEGKSINLVKWGNGKTKVMLWSQMHGDEATGTMALFDLLNFLQSDHQIVESLKANCELIMVPMVNPDGAERFTRRNAQQIDINRDYLQLASPEGKLLKSIRDNYKPDFGFNLHDQTTLWSVSGSLKPATLSFLAPAYNKELSVNQTRERAMLTIADIFAAVHPMLDGQIGLFDDEHEPRAFGDNFQDAGMSTILIEAGGLANDPEKQQIRQYYFAAILSGLHAIANQTYQLQNTNNYFAIPKNAKQIFHLLIHQLKIGESTLSVGINYEEKADHTVLKTFKTYSVEDIGDLSFCDAYTTIDATNLTLDGEIIFNKPANFNLIGNNEIILSFKNGDLWQKH